MKLFEVSSRKNKNGRRNFKAVLYRIFPNSCVDEVNQIGTMYNENGITWIREYCEKALPSINGMSIRCEFADEERTELLGHGNTDIVDGIPVFEDAVVIGTFKKGYIQDVETDNGIETYCIGEGEIDAQCYHNFITKLDSDIANGVYPSGSVEIMRTESNDGIVYKYGDKDKGRIPTEFVHSGYALLGVRPADDRAKLIELNKNHKEDLNKMTETEIKAIVSQTVAELSNYNSKISQCKEECNSKIEDVNMKLEQVISEKNEIIANTEQLQGALDSVQNDFKELDKKYTELYNEKIALESALGEAKAKERINEMNAAISEFSDMEKSYAKAEIDAFMSDPTSYEVNTIVNKIWECIGKSTKANNMRTSEQNSAEVNLCDIFGEVESVSASTKYASIF